jgi:hypothetical protein
MVPQAYAIPAVATAVEGLGPALAPLAIGAALVVLAAFLFLAWGAILHAPTAGLFVGADAWDVTPEPGDAADADAEAEGFDASRLVA